MNDSTASVLEAKAIGLLKYTLLLALAMCVSASAQTPVGAASEQAVWQALRSNGVVLFRHANAPGLSDPPSIKLGDCSTQRNLDDAGREQARQLGNRLRQQGVRVGQLLASQWCRTVDTARLMDVGEVREDSNFNSFFVNNARETAQTAAVRPMLLNWTGPGALVVVTHQVNITALTGINPASGEGVVLQKQDDRLVVVGRIAPN
jgi:phosphohistidine phosphatase SixA